MTKTKLAVLTSALLCSLAIGATSALASKGADDPLPQPCDDNGTDICVVSIPAVAKQGADDPLPQPCDDNGTDICFVKS